MRPAAWLLAGVALAACSSHSGGGAPDASAGTLVVGLTSDDTGGVVGAVHVTTTIDGAPATDDVVSLLDPKALPKEIALTAPATNASAKVAVRADGYQDPMWAPSRSTGTPVLTRTAEAAFVPNQSMLLRLHLESQCVQPIPGTAFTGPVCSVPGQTCMMGRCSDDTLLPTDLEPYRADWAADVPDVCRPADAGAPQVVVGTGQSDFLPITDGQTLTPELGPQGGHHVWIAVRMHNLKQSGSTTTITGVQPGTNVSIPPTAFVFTFDQDEGGYCKLFGLRYQLDNGGIDYHQFLGKPLDITVVVHDQTGATGTGVAHVNIDSNVLCPTTGMPCANP